MLKHIVFSQKNAAKKEKCMQIAVTKEKNGSWVNNTVFLYSLCSYMFMIWQYIVVNK